MTYSPKILGPMPRRPKAKNRRKQNPVKVTSDGREKIRNNGAGTRYWQKRRREVYDRDEGRCQGCGKLIPFVDAEIDHIRKRSLGGGDEAANLRTMCGGMFGCHARRHREEEGL